MAEERGERERGERTLDSWRSNEEKKKGETLKPANFYPTRMKVNDALLLLLRPLSLSLQVLDIFDTFYLQTKLQSVCLSH